MKSHVGSRRRLSLLGPLRLPFLRPDLSLVACPRETECQLIAPQSPRPGRPGQAHGLDHSETRPTKYVDRHGSPPRSTRTEDGQARGPRLATGRTHAVWHLIGGIPVNAICIRRCSTRSPTVSRRSMERESLAVATAYARIAADTRASVLIRASAYGTIPNRSSSGARPGTTSRPPAPFTHYGQRAPSEIIPSAARIAKPSPKPAYREVTSRSTFSLPTELPMFL
jgi:hypothetical protein